MDEIIKRAIKKVDQENFTVKPSHKIPVRMHLRMIALIDRKRP